MKSLKKLFLVGLVGVLASVSVYAQTKGVLLKNANVRKAPSLDAPIVKVIPKNTSIIILEKHGEWVSVGGGYIYSALIGDKPVKEEAPVKIKTKPKAQKVAPKAKKLEKKVTLVHQFTSVVESGEYLLDAKFVEFDKCDKFGWCKVKGKDIYVKEYLYLKKDDGRYMKRGPDLAYIYKKVAFPAPHNKNEKILNVNDFKGEERVKLNKKKNSKFGYVKLKELMANGSMDKEEKVVPKKEIMKEVVLEEPKEEVKKVVTKVEKPKPVVKKEEPKKVVQKAEPKPEPKKELSADEKRLLELQKLIEQYDKQLADLNQSK